MLADEINQKVSKLFWSKLIETRPSYDRYVRVSQQDKRTSFVCSFLGIKLAPDGFVKATVSFR